MKHIVCVDVCTSIPCPTCGCQRTNFIIWFYPSVVEKEDKTHVVRLSNKYFYSMNHFARHILILLFLFPLLTCMSYSHVMDIKHL